MNRRILLISMVVAALAGCAQGPRTTTPAATAGGMATAVPASFQGTWRQDQGGFIAIGADVVVLNLAGAPRRPARITTMTPVGDGTVALVLDNGWSLVVAAGRSLTSHQVAGLELVGDCPLIDVAVDGPGTATNVRLWNLGAATWLPVTGSPVANAAPRTPASTPAPAAPVATPDSRFAAEVAGLGDERLAEAARELTTLASNGAARGDLQAAVSETARRQRLVALDLLEAAKAGDAEAVAKADRLIDRTEAWMRLSQAWLESRG